MKKFFSLLIPAFLAFSAQGWASITFNATVSSDWNTAANWSTGAVPGTTDTGLIVGKTAIISGTLSSPTILDFALGSSSNTTAASTSQLNITGGAFTVTSGASLGRSDSATTSNQTLLLNLSGGSLTLGSGASSSTMTMGYTGTGTFSNNVAIATFSGGAYLGGLSVGSTYAGESATLIVQGGAGTYGARIAADGLAVNASGTLDFQLGAGTSNIISTLSYGSSTVSFASGAALVIDGTSYNGGNETLNLINYGTLTTLGNAVISYTGFNGYTATVVNNTGSDVVQLDIVAVPEPSVWGLFLVGSALWGGWGLRRRFAA